MTAACAGTTRRGGRCTMPAAGGSEFCYLHDPDPAVAERRRRNASRAATLGNSKVGQEIRGTRLLVRDLIEVTLAGQLDPVVKKQLTNVVQLVQTYARLAELEVTAGSPPRPGGVALPADTAERAAEFVEMEQGKARKDEEGKAALTQVAGLLEGRGKDASALRYFAEN